MRAEHLKGLRAIAGLAGLARRLVVHPGEKRERTADGIEVVPVADFVGMVASDTLFP